MFFVRNINIPIKWPGSLQESSGCVLQSFLDEVVGERFTETQMVDDVGDVGHVGGKVVAFGLGLDVEIARCTVDEEKTGNLTSGMFRF